VCILQALLNCFVSHYFIFVTLKRCKIKKAINLLQYPVRFLGRTDQTDTPTVHMSRTTSQIK